ncbi:hypothetical protein NFC81_00745 [Salinispirillum sp. LH 10-3-1]|uniref:Uncharacterized protein n=1 Tax=Salinispirillum sp. LH 10-3-1 TaxID=2952525 RepID=A0AB38YGB5_9GAMM
MTPQQTVQATESRPIDRDGRRFQVEPDRTSATRRVRYVETCLPTNGDCKVCQITG